MNKHNIYSLLIVMLLIQFIWYYSTLPGSILSPNKKYPRPTIKLGLTSYLIYLIPTLVIIYYFNIKDKTCIIANTYVELMCKK